MTPRWGNTFLFCSSKQLSHLRPRPLNGIFKLTWRPSRAFVCLINVIALLTNKDTIRCAAQVVEVPEHHQEQLLQTLIVGIQKALFSLIQKLEGPLAPPL